eukprot:EG_transcript_5840
MLWTSRDVAASSAVALQALAESRQEHFARRQQRVADGRRKAARVTGAEPAARGKGRQPRVPYALRGMRRSAGPPAAAPPFSQTCPPPPPAVRPSGSALRRRLEVLLRAAREADKAAAPANRQYRRLLAQLEGHATSDDSASTNGSVESSLCWTVPSITDEAEGQGIGAEDCADSSSTSAFQHNNEEMLDSLGQPAGIRPLPVVHRLTLEWDGPEGYSSAVPVVALLQTWQRSSGPPHPSPEAAVATRPAAAGPVWTRVAGQPCVMRAHSEKFSASPAPTDRPGPSLRERRSLPSCPTALTMTAMLEHDHTTPLPHGCAVRAWHMFGPHARDGEQASSEETDFTVVPLQELVLGTETPVPVLGSLEAADPVPVAAQHPGAEVAAANPLSVLRSSRCLTPGAYPTRLRLRLPPRALSPRSPARPRRRLPSPPPSPHRSIGRCPSPRTPRSPRRRFPSPPSPHAEVDFSLPSAATLGSEISDRLPWQRCSPRTHALRRLRSRLAGAVGPEEMDVEHNFHAACRLAAHSPERPLPAGAYRAVHAPRGAFAATLARMAFAVPDYAAAVRLWAAAASELNGPPSM